MIPWRKRQKQQESPIHIRVEYAIEVLDEYMNTHPNVWVWCAELPGIKSESAALGRLAEAQQFSPEREFRLVRRTVSYTDWKPFKTK